MNHPASDIRRQATRLLDSASVSHEPVSLRDVVSALNLELVGKTREPFTSEAALEPLGDGRAIVLNGAGDEAGRVEEGEANAFAAELLMPEHLVREAVREHGPDSVRLADRFEVSPKAMRARLRDLGLAERHGDK